MVKYACYLVQGKSILQQYHQELMEIQLDHSKSEKQGDVPVFTPALGVDALHDYASLYCIVDLSCSNIIKS